MWFLKARNTGIVWGVSQNWVRGDGKHNLSPQGKESPQFTWLPNRAEVLLIELQLLHSSNTGPQYLAAKGRKVTWYSIPPIVVPKSKLGQPTRLWSASLCFIRIFGFLLLTQVLKLLIVAWERRLIFTIGTSNTTGESDTVVWNEIHHKTEFGSNLTGHGYPDPNYLDNVLAELMSQGVSEANVKDWEDIFACSFLLPTPHSTICCVEAWTLPASRCLSMYVCVCARVCMFVYQLSTSIWNQSPHPLHISHGFRCLDFWLPSYKCNQRRPCGCHFSWRRIYLYHL